MEIRENLIRQPVVQEQKKSFFWKFLQKIGSVCGCLKSVETYDETEAFNKFKYLAVEQKQLFDSKVEEVANVVVRSLKEELINSDTETHVTYRAKVKQKKIIFSQEHDLLYLFAQQVASIEVSDQWNSDSVVEFTEYKTKVIEKVREIAKGELKGWTVEETAGEKFTNYFSLKNL